MADITNDLELLYKLDETSGTNAVDSSANGRDGTLQGGQSFVGTEGQLGNALLIDTSSSKYLESVNVSAFDFQEDSTLAFWANIAAGSSQTPIAKTTGWNGLGWYVTYAPDTLRFYSFVGGASDVTRFDATEHIDEWHHYTFRMTGTSMDIFVDGVEVTVYANKGTHNTMDPATATTLKMGNTSGTISTMDDIRFYTRALADADILALLSPYAAAAMRSHQQLLIPAGY
jgi:hypothetical protein